MYSEKRCAGEQLLRTSDAGPLELPLVCLGAFSVTLLINMSPGFPQVTLCVHIFLRVKLWQNAPHPSFVAWCCMMLHDACFSWQLVSFAGSCPFSCRISLRFEMLWALPDLCNRRLRSMQSLCRAPHDQSRTKAGLTSSDCELYIHDITFRSVPNSIWGHLRVDVRWSFPFLSHFLPTFPWKDFRFHNSSEEPGKRWPGFGIWRSRWLGREPSDAWHIVASRTIQKGIFMDFLWFPAPILRLIEGPKCNEKDDAESVQFQMSLLFVCMLFVNTWPSSTCLLSARPPRKLQPVICTYVPRVRFVCLQPRKTLHINPEAKPQVPEAFETLTRFLHQSDTWQLAFGCLWGEIWKDHGHGVCAVDQIVIMKPGPPFIVNCILVYGVLSSVFVFRWLMSMSDMMQDDAGMLQHCCLEEFKRHRKSRLLGSGNVFGPIWFSLRGGCCGTFTIIQAV